MTSENQRFSYVRYDQESIAIQESLKQMFETIDTFVDAHIAPGRAQSLIFTYLEIAYMWTGKAIRDAQIARDGKIEHDIARET